MLEWNSMNKKTLVILGIVIVLAIILFLIFGLDVLKKDNSSGASQVAQNSSQDEQGRDGQDVRNDPIKPFELGVEEAAKELIGLWKSLDREGYTVRINADGSYLEDLENVTSTEATWRLSDSINQEEVGASENTEGIFLEQAFPGAGKFYYRILELSSNRLIMMYLDNGEILGFERG